MISQVIDSRLSEMAESSYNMALKPLGIMFGEKHDHYTTVVNKTQKMNKRVRQ